MLTDKSGERELQSVISAHNVELDSKMGGGLPTGSLTLIEGGSGSGKSVLSQQILWGALQDGFSASIFTSENTVRSLVSQMEKLDLDILDFLLMRRCRIYPMALARLGENALPALLSVLKQQERDLVIIDSLTAAVMYATESAPIIRFFEECKHICSDGVSIIITLHAQGVSDEVLNPLRSMCDASLKLRVEQDGQRLVKTLEVTKVRGAASVTGAVVGFDVEPGWGMRVIPISKARG
ncbi:MAG: ATPase domain-containing protein [Chloroflexota bacterium]|nr:ATPase domain-containing protein [Chloroflexota bacterium]